MGEVSFKISILNRVTTVSGWVTNEIPPGQLILGSGVLEDLNLPLQDIPDLLSRSGHAEDTDTIKDPRGCSPVTRASKLRLTSHGISHPQNPPNAFLTQFENGFRREIVLGATGKKSAYFIAPGGAKIRGKKDLGPYISTISRTLSRKTLPSRVPNSQSSTHSMNTSGPAKPTQVAPQHLARSHWGHTNPPMTPPNQPGKPSNTKTQTIIGTRHHAGNNPRTSTSKMSSTWALITQNHCVGTSGICGNKYPPTTQRKRRYPPKHKMLLSRTMSIPNN